MGAISYQVAEHREQEQEPEPVTPGAQEALGLLERHDRAGWSLSGLTTAEMAAIDAAAAVVSDARPLQEREIGSPTSQLLYRCHEAMRQERARRDLAYQREVDQQRRRVENLVAASRRIEDAARLLEQAEAVEDRRAELLPRTVIEAIDPGTMTDAELQNVIAEDERAVEGMGGYAASMAHVADVLNAVKDQRFRRHARTAEAIAAEAAEDADAHRARIRAARAELDARAERERMEQEADAPARAADVSELAARVAEIEGQLAGRDR